MRRQLVDGTSLKEKESLRRRRDRRPAVARGIVILSCLFLLLSGILNAVPSLDGPLASPVEHYAGSLEAAPDVDAPAALQAGEEQCRGAVGCSSLFLPASAAVFVARTQVRSVGLEDTYRGIGPSPGLRPPRLSFSA